jgi:hypothetical protein
MKLDRRSYRLEIGDLKIESISTAASYGPPSLAFEFSIERKESPDPNSAEFVIENLNEEHRSILSKDEQTVRFAAGYQDSLEILFFGVVRRAVSWKEQATTYTRVQAGDADSKIVTSKVSKSFAKGAMVSSVLEEIVKSMGVKPGNLAAMKMLAKTSAGSTLPHGLCLNGDAAANMSALCASLGIVWSVQNDVLQLRLASVPAGSGPLLSATTGLIGAPQMEPKNVITWQSLLIPGCVPGNSVSIKSGPFTGTAIIDQTRHFGHTHGNDWLIDCKGKAA